MPLYEYFCQNCENRFKIRSSISEKEKGLKASSPNCSSDKTIQIFGSIFTFSKGSGSSFGGSWGLIPTPWML